MQFLDDASVSGFLAQSGLRMPVFGSAADLSSQVFGRQLAELEQELQGRIDIGLLDITRAAATAGAWGVVPQNLPVQVVFVDGVMQRVLLGVRSARGLRAEVEEYLEAA